jgi:branched-chain amino acid transport system substrate-binding protein
VKDTKGDFVKAVRLCREVIEEDNVVCVIGPLRSESVVGAAAVAEYSKIPLITPTASKSGLASLGDYVFQLSPSPESKGRSLAEFVMREQNLQDFVMLIPEEGQNKTEALSFKETVEELGGKVVAIEYYPPGTQSFSPYLRKIKNMLLGPPSSSLPDEDESFFDQIPVWVDGFFISADQSEIYDILSQIINLHIYATIIGPEGCGNQQVLEFAQNLDREIIFTSDAFPQNNDPQRQRLLKLYYDQYEKYPDRVSMLGYDSMNLLLSIFENVSSPEKINDALLRIFDFKGVAGEIHFDPEGENIYVPIYKLENGWVKRVR